MHCLVYRYRLHVGKIAPEQYNTPLYWKLIQSYTLFNLLPRSRHCLLLCLRGILRKFQTTKTESEASKLPTRTVSARRGNCYDNIFPKTIPAVTSRHSGGNGLPPPEKGSYFTWKGYHLTVLCSTTGGRCCLLPHLNLTTYSPVVVFCYSASLSLIY